MTTHELHRLHHLADRYTGLSRSERAELDRLSLDWYQEQDARLRRSETLSAAYSEDVRDVL